MFSVVSMFLYCWCVAVSCRADAVRDLCTRLSTLERDSGGAPLVSVRDGGAPQGGWMEREASEGSMAPVGSDWEEEQDPQKVHVRSGDEWELL
jgi:hypothetical protein